MPKSKDYFEFAAQCRKFASKTDSLEQREILLRMAETWTILAEKLEITEQGEKSLEQ